MPEPYELSPQGGDVFRTFVIPIPLNGDAVRTRAGVSSGQLQGRASREHQDRSHTVFETMGRAGSRARAITAAAAAKPMFPGRTFSRLDSGTITSHLAAGYVLAARTRQRSRDRNAFDARRNAREGAGERRSVLHRARRRPGRLTCCGSGGRTSISPRDNENTSARTRTPCQSTSTCSGVQPHAHYLAQGDPRIGEVARRHDNAADLHQGVGLSLAGHVRACHRHYALPKGTVVSMRYTYDNSAANPRNPNRPPRRVTFGQTSASEMGSLWLQVLRLRQQRISYALDADFSPKLLADDIAGNEKWLEMNPRDAQIHAELAMCYYEAGRHAAMRSNI